MSWRFLNNLLTIAVVVRAHSILGELLVKYYAESMELLECALFLGRDKESATPILIENVRYHNEKLLIRIQGITNRTEAEQLRGYFLYIHADQLPSLSEGEVYRFSLFGFSIYAHGNYLGILEDIQDIAGQELWYIRTEYGEEVLFPAVEHFIDSMDFEHQIIYISPPDGLLELYINQE